VRDFKLNTQCSAGNGYFLQSTAEGLGSGGELCRSGVQRQSHADFWLRMRVFLQSDIVNFQRQGWRAHEILAGLATVLPRNVFLHVASANLPRWHTYVLQGGTQNNLAAVKARWISRRYLRHSGSSRDMDSSPLRRIEHRRGHRGDADPARGKSDHLYRHGRGGNDPLFNPVRRANAMQLLHERVPAHFLSVAGTNAAAPGESRRIVLANCEKGRPRTLMNCAGFRQGWKRQGCEPNLLQCGARGVPLAAAGACRDPFRGAHGTRRAGRDLRCAGTETGSHRHSACAQHVCICPVVQRLSRKLGRGGGEHRVFERDLRRDVPVRLEPGSIDPCYPSKIAIAHVKICFSSSIRARRST